MDNTITNEHAARFLEVLKRQDYFKHLSDAELSDFVVTKVWGHLVFSSDQEFALNELIDRFEEMKGIKRNQDGEIIKQ